MNVHEVIRARKPKIEKAYTEAPELTLDQFLENLRRIIGSLTPTQTRIYTRIYHRERSKV